jgi:hypothetical protein
MISLLHTYRNWVIAIGGGVLWIAAYLWFFWGDIMHRFRTGKEHRWWVDLEIKKGGRGPPPKRP